MCTPNRTMLRPRVVLGPVKESSMPRPRPKPAESAKQTQQRELVERARSLPGVAEVLDVYGRLSAYTNVVANVQPSQVRNATGGNPR